MAELGWTEIRQRALTEAYRNREPQDSRLALACVSRWVWQHGAVSGGEGDPK